jgi:RNA polymerase sigma factor (sigma-70 family)
MLTTAEPDQAESKTARYHSLVIEEVPRVNAARDGCPEALDLAAQVTLPARRKVAEYFLGARHTYLEDATQHGWFGVLRALPKYDPKRMIRFSDYCVPQIYNKIGKFRFDVPHQIRIPAWAHEARRKAGKDSANVSQTIERLVETGMARHVAVVVSTMNFASIQDEYCEEDRSQHRNCTSLADPTDDVVQAACLEEEYHWVQYAMSTLSKKEQAVLKAEFRFSQPDGNPIKTRLRRMGLRRRKTYLAALSRLHLQAQRDDIRPGLNFSKLAGDGAEE